MLPVFLSPVEVTKMKDLYKTADKKQRDMIKAILMLNKGYDYSEIADVLLIDYTTVWRWHETYLNLGIDGLLKDGYLGGSCKLHDDQLSQLIEHLECTVYLTAKEICAFVRKTFKVKYTQKGMKSLLHQLDFTYKL